MLTLSSFPIQIRCSGPECQVRGDQDAWMRKLNKVKRKGKKCLKRLTKRMHNVFYVIIYAW